MNNKAHIGFRIDHELLEKFRYICGYEGHGICTLCELFSLVDCGRIEAMVWFIAKRGNMKNGIALEYSSRNCIVYCWNFRFLPDRRCNTNQAL